MKTLIRRKIDELKKQMGIRVLCAIESGSRAWGFESPDSDYDVRLLYVYPKEKYTTVKPVIEDINLPVDENLIDIAGWELVKAGRLVVNKSNASPFEWIQSSIVYEEKDGFRQAFSEVIEQYFDPARVIHHYLGLAKGTLHKHLQGDKVKIKKYFYALRPILCAWWVLEQNEMAPLQFSEVRKVLKSDSVNGALDALLKQKETAVEGYLIERNSILDEFITTSLEEIAERVRDLKSSPTEDGYMNKFFNEWIS